jgi:hypothetical protein
MGFAILAWLVLLYLFSSKPGWFACSSSSSSTASSLQDADEREPRRQIGWRGSLRFAMSKERGRSGLVSGPSPGQRRRRGCAESGRSEHRASGRVDPNGISHVVVYYFF